MLSIAQTLQQAERRCAARGARFTPVRARVLTLLLQADRPQTAYQLLDQLRALQPSAQPPTVYRALEFLLQHGLAHRLESGNRYTACHLHAAEPGHWSQFLICSRCGNTRELPVPAPLQQQLAAQAEQAGMVLQPQVMELQGLCGACQAGDD